MILCLAWNSQAHAQFIEPDWAWSLDRPTISGTTINPQFGATSMTMTGSPTTNVDAIRGQGITTNGTSQYFGVGSTLPATNGSWSLCYWMKPTSFSGVAWGILSPNQIWDGFYSSGGRSLTPVRQINFGSGVTAPGILVAGRWYHVCFAKSSTQMWAYGNGQGATANPVTINQTPALGDQRLYFGTDNQLGGFSNYWGGTVDDIRLYNRQISDGEVKMIYYQGVGAHSFNF